MKKIGLTGSIGSGKSLIAKVFQNLGIPVFNADIEAKKLYEDLRFLEEISKEFGNEVVEDGVLIRPRLANIVFNNRERLEKLNSMTHPKVLERFEEWAKEQSTAFVLHESAILFESGWREHFDAVISVYTPLEVVIERVIKRDGIAEEEVMKRYNNQMNMDDKRDLADYIIYHDNKKMVMPQILDIYNELIKR